MANLKSDILSNELHCGDVWLVLHELLTTTGSIIIRVRNGHLLMWKCASANEPFGEFSIRSGKACFPDYEEEKGGTKACCCALCTLVQAEKETKIREAESEGVDGQYSQAETMSYAPKA